MPLFAGSRDVSLFRRLNRELMQKIVDTEVAVYKFDVENTEENIYGEAVGGRKLWYNPVRVHCLINRSKKNNISSAEILDYNRTAVFAFLRDDLVDKNLVILEGDVIEWDKSFYELNKVSSGQLWSGKNPETLFASVVDQYGEHGYRVSVVCEGYKVAPEKIGITNIRTR